MGDVAQNFCAILGHVHQLPKAQEVVPCKMTVAGKDDHFTRDDLLRLGALMDVPKNGAEILRDVEDALGAWDAESAHTGLSPEWQVRIRGLFRHFA